MAGGREKAKGAEDEAGLRDNIDVEREAEQEDMERDVESALSTDTFKAGVGAALSGSKPAEERSETALALERATAGLGKRPEE